MALKSTLKFEAEVICLLCRPRTSRCNQSLLNTSTLVTPPIIQPALLISLSFILLLLPLLHEQAQCNLGDHQATPHGPGQRDQLLIVTPAQLSTSRLHPLCSSPYIPTSPQSITRSFAQHAALQQYLVSVFHIISRLIRSRRGDYANLRQEHRWGQ